MADTNLLDVLGQATEAVNTDNATDFSPIETPAAEPEADYSEDFGPENDLSLIHI